MSSLVRLSSLQQWQDDHTFHVDPNITFMGIFNFITTITKNTDKNQVKFTALVQLVLTHYEYHLLCMAHIYPYEGQSSHLMFTMTKTLYIWVMQNHLLHLELVSPYEWQTSCPSFS